jgi:hypothetical protein
MQGRNPVADAQRDDEALTITDLISAYEKGVEELRLAGGGVNLEDRYRSPGFDVIQMGPGDEPVVGSSIFTLC